MPPKKSSGYPIHCYLLKRLTKCAKRFVSMFCLYEFILYTNVNDFIFITFRESSHINSNVCICFIRHEIVFLVVVGTQNTHLHENINDTEHGLITNRAD